ncbi:NAD-dependent epimerase/dehydratase family protein [Kitasatospora sp. NPDC056446]|uniref:NAD-dependent epimerase/dehydratase family protein n=1 Tax=Kitasatospora sp. NPDC056446 TaxID=3345819 RepID=UPI0036CB88AD
MSARTALVLGGTGFVGRHVCAALAGDGYRTLAVGRRPAGAAAPPPDTGYRVLAGSTPAALGALFDTERPDLVVNAAGTVWQPDPERMARDNAGLVTSLVTAAAARPAPPRLVQLGSVHEYGPTPDGEPIAEDRPERPETPYGRTKLQGTRTVLAARGVPAVVLRVSNVLGPGAPTGSLPGLVAARLAQARRDGTEAVLELSPLIARRDFVDARDVGAAVLCAAGADGAVGRIVNIGSGAATGVRELVAELVRISGVPARVVERGEQEGTRSRSMDWQQLDVALAARLLGWHPRRSVTASLADLWHSVVFGPHSTVSQGPGSTL